MHTQHTLILMPDMYAVCVVLVSRPLDVENCVRSYCGGRGCSCATSGWVTFGVRVRALSKAGHPGIKTPDMRVGVDVPDECWRGA